MYIPSEPASSQTTLYLAQANDANPFAPGSHEVP